MEFTLGALANDIFWDSKVSLGYTFVKLNRINHSRYSRFGVSSPKHFYFRMFNSGLPVISVFLLRLIFNRFGLIFQRFDEGGAKTRR